MWLGKDRCPLRLLEVPYVPRQAPKPVQHTQSQRAAAAADTAATAAAADAADANADGGGGSGGRPSEGIVVPTAGTAAPATAKAAPRLRTVPSFRIGIGKLYKRSETSGRYRKLEVAVEGATLSYTGIKGEQPGVLRASSIERVERVSLSKYEFALITKMESPERGHTYSFRATGRADFELWVPSLERWLETFRNSSIEPASPSDGNLGTPQNSAASSTSSVTLSPEQHALNLVEDGEATLTRI